MYKVWKNSRIERGKARQIDEQRKKSDHFYEYSIIVILQYFINVFYDKTWLLRLHNGTGSVRPVWKDISIWPRAKKPWLQKTANPNESKVIGVQM